MTMQLGNCGGTSCAEEFMNAGFDYYEMCVSDLCCPRDSEEKFAANLRAAQTAVIPCKKVNCFIPGDLKICGPEVDTAALNAYALTAIVRAAAAGVDTIVFGSGGARAVPEGFSRETAQAQIYAFARYAAAAAEKHNITIVLEPLNHNECNILNSVAECAALVRAVNNQHFRLLVDSYHWGLDGGTEQEIRDAADLITHVHVATWPGRRAPGAEECNLAGFFRILESIGYDGCISFEGCCEDRARELPEAVRLMRLWAA